MWIAEAVSLLDPLPGAVALKDTLASRKGRTSLQPFPSSIPAIHIVDIAALAAPMKNVDRAIDGREENRGEARHGQRIPIISGCLPPPCRRTPIR